jgi:hypothetical protein
MSEKRRPAVKVRWFSAQLGPCPRCGTARSVTRKSDSYGTYRDCLVCGWHGYEDAAVVVVPEMAESETHQTAGDREVRAVASG